MNFLVDLDQLAEVFRRLQFTRRDVAPLSRCGECNHLLTPVPRETALGLVPDHVFQTQAEFFQCPRCRRLYWPGSHHARIIDRLQQVLPEQQGDRHVPN
ncbi:MAG: Mut7-C RNAse domain-containing protein [Syntrophobacterales bacterium]